ncbi:unnamed protein product [Eruca vesicaria subsp. sativa]|uniref:Plant thionin family protein n=1 Tax=Eruca vesicaria subsp. sativa TaxID=29727 RepID=A0ABC8LZ04_ERUVS|nr:unnamed protein product [Eruca vesicaria subsp. sativa]
MAGKVCMLMALIMIGCVLQACNGANAGESNPTENSKMVCFKTCSIACGKENKPCHQECLTKCGLPKKPSTTA